jgi:hypothetical protein
MRKRLQQIVDVCGQEVGREKAILREAAKGITLKDLCRKHGIPCALHGGGVTSRKYDVGHKL